MSNPLVSVLMTAYNREKLIGPAIESVLASTYSDLELIVVDDRSSDSTVAIANDYAGRDRRIKVFINEKNLGDYPNRNRAASHAKGKYLKYLDSDDMIYKYGLHALVYFMEQDEEAGMGISYKRNIVHQPFPMILKPSESLRYHFFTEGFLDCGPTGTIIKRECFEAVGGFSGKRMIGDLEFALKLASRYKVMILPPSLSFWRDHGDQEIAFGIANDMYNSMSEQMLRERFAGLPESVLTEAERNTILGKMSRDRRWGSAKKFIKRIIFRK